MPEWIAEENKEKFYIINGKEYRIRASLEERYRAEIEEVMAALEALNEVSDEMDNLAGKLEAIADDMMKSPWMRFGEWINGRRMDRA